MDEIDALTSAYQEKVDTYYRDYRAASTDEERQALAGKFPDASEVARPLMLLVAAAPASEEAAKAAIWVLRHSRATQPEEVITILRAQALSADFSDLALASLYSQTEAVSAVLEQVIDENPHPAAKAAAAFARSQAMGRTTDADDAVRKRMLRLLGIAVEHGDTVMLGKRSIADRARAAIFEEENLQIGMQAPEISGEDIGGNALALSDYRGKVVVIDFWGDW